MSVPDTYNDYLAHYGIKGMKWGRRRDPGPDGIVGTKDTAGSKTKSSPKEPNKVFNKKNAKIAAGVVGTAAVIGVSAMGARHIQKGRKAAAVAKMDAVINKSFLDMYLDTAPKPAPKPTYKPRAKKTDTKLYGKNGAERIEKKLNQGVPLRTARQKEAVRKGSTYALKVAANLALARIQS